MFLVQAYKDDFIELVVFERAEMDSWDRSIIMGKKDSFICLC